MYRLLLLFTVCTAIEDDFADYWYSNDDGMIDDGDTSDTIRYDDVDEPESRPKTLRTRNQIKIEYIRERDSRSLPTNSNQVLKLLGKVFKESKCDSSNAECKAEELDKGVDIIMDSQSISGILSNIQDLINNNYSELVEDQVLEAIFDLNEDDQELLLEALTR